MRFLTKVIFFLSILIYACICNSMDKVQTKIEPVDNKGKKWRIAYYEGGPYIDYQKVFYETIRGLMEIGWIQKAELPEQKGEDNLALWKWLSINGKSNFIEFPEDAFYSASWMNDSREKIVNDLMRRLNQKKDIDLLLTLGTMAGQDFSNSQHNTPTLVLTASDPVASGIIESVEDSGLDHLHATIDPTRYERQIRIFHEIIGFKKLGIAYEDSINGRSYAAVQFVERVAKDRNFKIVRCFTLDESVDDANQREESVFDCFKELLNTTDAIYVTQQGGINENNIFELAMLAIERKVPTFSQAGSSEVQAGFLLSLSQAGFRYVGEFQAEIIAQVFNGAKPRQLTQLFEEPPKIAINLKTAEIIGFDPPMVLLGAADEIFYDIVKP